MQCWGCVEQSAFPKIQNKSQNISGVSQEKFPCQHHLGAVNCGSMEKSLRIGLISLKQKVAIERP